MLGASPLVLKDFEVLSVIGRGSSAKVFLVEQIPSKRLYAMKVLKKESLEENEVGTHF